MKIAYVRWRDAKSEEAVEPHAAVKPGLATLNEVGFLLAEDDTVVVIGMEIDGDDGDTAPGRWRLHIPRQLIQEMRVIELDAFKAMPQKRGRKKRAE